ncbi:MAG TPA: KUP/HAK/KT family potassium transporter [Methanoregulaceae archaeon]|nr:KUP/HAK/KT family potassium transporter [Methanoregulaceae archaeon]HRY76031.1 KUP/HAK/KT family potassium transporter [Methanoregulaceae archaeon]
MAGTAHSPQAVIRSLGIVFGDIGTSPIYTIGAILLFILPAAGNILGVLSLIVWSLAIVITVQYAYLAMSLGSRGEGGTIVLKELLAPRLKSPWAVTFVSGLTIIGVALFIGDGVITPAISILSAVEGIRFIPGFHGIWGGWILATGICIAIALFAIQRKGTGRIAWAFGPVMLVWFVSLAVTGLVSIASAPQVLLALSPTYALGFLLENGVASFIVLSAVLLCVTGGEALYADMGHLGREPIVRAWYCIFPALVLCYLGQGAYVLNNPEVRSAVLFSMVQGQAPFLYVPFLLLSIGATVIASQAMISGMFSIVYQGMMIRIIPKMKVEFTSPELRSQIYIEAVNWMLLLSVVIVMLEFETSENLASAYGLAVAGTMTISAVLIAMISALQKDAVKTALSGALIVVDAIFLLSAFTKIPHGAYWSFLIAAVPLVIIVTFIRGQDQLHRMMRPKSLEEFLAEYRQKYGELPRVRGTALFFTADKNSISPYISRVMNDDGILYEDNILVSIRITDKPFGIQTNYDRNLAPGLHAFTIIAGYMEFVDVIGLLHDDNIHEKTIFYGVENIVSDKFFWKIYAIIKKVSPAFVQFYELPADKVHGVVTRVVM